jgi:hypothetical protein
VGSADINVLVLFDWSDILPHAIGSLSPLHREIVTYILNRPGRRRPPYTHALREWNLDRDQLDAEMEAAYRGIRQFLRRQGISNSSDLEFG